MSSTNSRFVRLGETGRAQVGFSINGRPASALQGDTPIQPFLINRFAQP